MKIIVTGSTGYIGRQVLLCCLESAKFTSVVSISRRDPEVTHPKLSVILHSDFLALTPQIISELEAAQVLIYCLGTNVPVSPPELNRKINFDFTISTARAFADAHRSKSSPGRFVYLSGALPEKDPNKRIWFIPGVRKMRGEVENALLQLKRDRQDSGLSLFITRPGFVMPNGAVLRALVVGSVFQTIEIDALAMAMVGVSEAGFENVLVENDDMKAMAKEIHGTRRDTV